ncbi:MAG: threonine synthase [Gemmatimonadales bacterium]|nr:threonine synthase [Gemmatimonadales bacterium]
MTFHWSLECSSCSATRDAQGLATVCPDCGAPWLVRYATYPGPEVKHALATRPWTMWRYREWMPIRDGEEPVTMGEGCTPLVPVPHLAREVGLRHLWVKDESQNPTGSFKARGLSAAVTRAQQAGATRFSVPTAGNAGVATSAYGRRAGIPVHVFAPQSTPPRILEQIRGLGADLRLLDGHIGDCGKAARAYAAEQDAFDVSTLREPYRIEGKKTLGLEIAEQLGWELPDAIIYPTGGGTGLIGMWIAFRDLRDAGWVGGELPRLFSVQSSGCAPVVRAFETGAERTSPWEDPQTVAAGLRVPAPLGGPIILRAIQETRGGAVAVSDEDLCEAQARMATLEGLDACPEGGATLAALEVLLAEGDIARDQRVILFNTGAGWLYRAN